MDVFFITLLNMSIKAGWLIITVVIIRALFKNMPKWTRCILWGLVVVRLICPYAFESRLSLVPDTRVISLSKEPDDFNASETTDTVIGTALRDAYYPTQDGAISSLNQESIKKDNGIKYAITKYIVSFVNMDIISLQNIFYVIEAVWLIGFFALIIYAIVNYIKLRKSISEAIPFKYEGYQNDRKYAVMIADAVKTPFIMGVLCPKIYIPSDTGEDKIKYILEHEMTHIKRRDYLWKLIGYVVLAVYCFNPLIWIAYALFCRDLELACDEKVISKYDENEKKSYSETLLLCSMQKKSVLCCPPAFGETAVKERIKAVINHKKTKISTITVSIVVCVIVAVCFLTSPVTSSAMTVAKDYMENTQVEIEEGDVIITTSSVTVSDNAGYEISFTNDSKNYYIVTVKEMTVSDRFKQYEDYDITYKDKSGQSGKGNVYYKGECINSFRDINPKEGTFTYQSVDKGNINVTVIYNSKGDRIGIEVQK